MTTPHDIYLEATRRGLRLEPAGDMLAVLPKGKCPPDFRDVLRQHKAELLNWLTCPQFSGWQSAPPADLPLVPVLPETSTANARRVVAYEVRQIADGTSPLCEWLVRRETAYWEAYHWPDHACTYAAARDAACWQLRRDEVAVWELLAAFDELAR